jgi:hypothetical protein
MTSLVSNLDLMSSAVAQKEVIANNLFNAASPAMAWGRRESTTSGLSWGYYGGAVKATGGLTVIPNGVITLPGSSTSYIERDNEGVVSSNTTAFTLGRMALYTVVTDSTHVTTYADYRMGGGGSTPGIASDSALGLIRTSADIVVDGAGIATVPALANRLRVDVDTQGLTSPEKANAIKNLGMTRIASTPHALTYSSSLTVDVADYDVFDLTLTGNITLSFSNGVDGRKVMLRLRQDSTGGWTVAFGAGVRFGTDIASYSPTLTPNKLDYLLLIYNATDSKYDVISYNRGF